MTSATVQVAGRLPAKSLVVVHTGGNDFIQKYSASWVHLSLRPLGFEISPGLRPYNDLFKDYRFVRVISGQGVDISYNLQLRCEGHAQLTEFRSKHEPMLEKIVQLNFEGKYASFQSVLEQICEDFE